LEIEIILLDDDDDDDGEDEAIGWYCKTLHRLELNLAETI